MERAATVDRYAKLLLGWSRLLSAGNLKDEDQVHEGLSDLSDALHQWAYQNDDRNQRNSWLRHIRRLHTLGTRFQQEAQSLIEFANTNANWGRIELDSLGPAPTNTTSAPEDVLDD